MIFAIIMRNGETRTAQKGAKGAQNGMEEKTF